MGNGIGRKRTLGIALEGTYGVPAAIPTFVLPVLEVPRFKLVQNKVRNVAALGSTYQTNNIKNITKMINFSMPIKIDEDQLPIFFKQKFTINSALISGETSVYQHTLSYNTNNGPSYTLFFEDGDRVSEIISGVKFSALNLTANTKDYIKLDITGVGKAPVTWTGTNTVVAPKEFTGVHAVFNYGDYGGSKAATSILNAVLNHTFNLSGDDENFALGSAEMVNVYNKEDDFQGVVEAMFDAITIRNEYLNNTEKQFDLTITDTGRNITGSAINTKPYIQFNYPAGFVEGWDESGGLADLLKQSLTLTPIDRIGLTTSPLTIIIKNATASY
jgi:hypothetical protein